MNGVHDMGGMDGFGPVIAENNEPVFHEAWEGRMHAMVSQVAGRHFRNIDEFRHAIERIPAPLYLASSYYERWLNAMMTLLVEKGKVTREELVACGAAPVDPAQPANHHAAPPAKLRPRKPRFREGDRIVARNLNPTGHTRLPRYVRGKRGIIEHDWGEYVFADSNAHNAGKHAQHVYSVRFDARELWGPEAPRKDTMRIDLWEDYLEPDHARSKASKRKKP